MKRPNLFAYGLFLCALVSGCKGDPLPEPPKVEAVEAPAKPPEMEKPKEPMAAPPLKQEIPEVKGRPNSAEFSRGDIGYVVKNPRINGRTILFDIMVTNVGEKSIKLGTLKPLRRKDDITLANGDAYVFMIDNIFEDGVENNLVIIKTDYLANEKAKILYPGEAYEFTVRLDGVNFPVSNLEVSILIGRIIFEKILYIKLFEANGKLQIEDLKKDSRLSLPPMFRLPDKNPPKKGEGLPKEEGKLPNPPPEPKPEAPPVPMEKPKPKIDPAKVERFQKAQADYEKKRSTLGDLEKAYRESARKSVEADKADQFADRDRWKKQSLEEYQQFKKRSQEVEDLKRQLKKLEREAEGID